MLVLSSFALADLTISEVTLGGHRQRRSNPDEDINETIQATITLTNNGNKTVTNLEFNKVGIDSKYAIKFINPPSEIAANSSKDITIQGYVPIDLDATDNNGNKIAVLLGTINVFGKVGNVTTNTATSNVYMEARNMLEIDRMDISWNGEDESIDDGETVENIKPGDNIELKIKVENLFDDSDDEDFDIEDVEARIEVDDEFDVDDENKDVGDIDAEETEEITFNMEVESDADEDTYTLIIEVVGEDENGAKHGEKWTIDLEVEREREDIRIMTAELIPESISCNRNIRLEVEIENIGSRDSDEIVLLVESDDFDYREKIANIDLDTEDDYDKTFSINVPEDAEEGIYLFSVKTFFDADDYNDDDYNDAKDVMLTVRDCETTPPAKEEDEKEDEEEENGDIIVQPPTTTPTGDVVYGQPVSAIDDFFDSNAYIALLAVGALIGIALLFLAIAILVKR